MNTFSTHCTFSSTEHTDYTIISAINISKGFTTGTIQYLKNSYYTNLSKDILQVHQSVFLTYYVAGKKDNCVYGLCEPIWIVYKNMKYLRILLQLLY